MLPVNKILFFIFDTYMLLCALLHYSVVASIVRDTMPYAVKGLSDLGHHHYQGWHCHGGSFVPSRVPQAPERGRLQGQGQQGHRRRPRRRVCNAVCSGQHVRVLSRPPVKRLPALHKAVATPGGESVATDARLMLE